MILTGLISASLASLAYGAPRSSPHPDHGHHGLGKVVDGIVFDRFITIWLENTDFAPAAADPNFQALTKQGIQLTNYFGVTHPSEPNYVSAAGGDYFGMDNDDFNSIPANVSTVVDLLEHRKISWGEYQEGMPSTGFTGFDYLDDKGNNNYVRKHNPLIIYDSVATVPDRANRIKNFTLFQEDLANNALPQWIFITPNMTNDGHDTSVTFASQWSIDFLTPLLKNPHFNGPKTLIILTFDENDTDNSELENRVNGVLLGNAVPRELIGTQDATFYNHYSTIATVEANWKLHTLGRYDVGANVFKFIAKKTGDVTRSVDLSQTFLNASYPGVFNSVTKAPLPIPNTSLVVNGRTVFKTVKENWGSRALQKCTVYNGGVEVPSALNPPVLPQGC